MNPDLTVTGSIPLTRSLLAKLASGTLHSLAEAEVEPYLAKSLSWRVQGPKGTAVDPSTIQNFELSVIASTTTRLASSAELPVWSVPSIMRSVTEGKAGGLSTSNATLS